MTNVTFASVSVKIGGQEISEEMWGCVLELVVDTTLHMPDMFTIRLLDYTHKWMDDSSLDVGKEVEIKAGNALLLKGEITALEPDFEETGRATLLLRGYDKSHRLHLGRQTRTFLNRKDSDLASQIAQEAGLRAQVDATSVTHDYVLQNNQTNMEFLLARAQRNGYQVFVTDGSLYFKKGDSNQGQGPTLKWGHELCSFRPRLTTAHQANTAIVRGWDAKQKEVIEGQATQSLTQGGVSQTGGAKAQSAFQQGKEYIVSSPVATVDEARAMATGLSHDLAREFMQAEGVCFGDPELKAGKTVTIQDVGTRFSGSYFVTSAMHIFDKEGRYRTTFSVSGRQPNTLSHLLDSGDGHGPDWGLVEGVVPAMVTNLDDPDGLGRVKVKFPWLPDGDNIESWWARVAAPMAGPERGFMCLPEINDEVLVAFEHGDTHCPYVVGALWNNKDKLPKPQSEVAVNGKVEQRVLKTRQGHEILLNDKEGEEQISVTSKSGHTVILDDKSGSEKITIQDKTGSNSMVIDSSNNSMTIKVNGDFSVVAKGKITLKSTQDMTLQSSAMSNIKSTGNMTVKATGNLSLQATGMGELKGTMLTVDGGPMTTVKGGLVKIN